MIRFLLVLIICFLTLGCAGQSKDQGDNDNELKYDFDESKYTFDSPDELVNSFINTLEKQDSNKILEHFLSKEATYYLLEQFDKKRPDAQNIEEAIKATESKFEEGQNQYITVSRNLLHHIQKDSVSLSKAKITSINYVVGDWYGLKPNVMFTAVSISISYIDNVYLMRLPQLIRIKNKWFIGGPEISWQNQAIGIYNLEGEEPK